MDKNFEAGFLKSAGLVRKGVDVTARGVLGTAGAVARGAFKVTSKAVGGPVGVALSLPQLAAIPRKTKALMQSSMSSVQQLS